MARGLCAQTSSKIAGWGTGSRAVEARLPPCAGEKRKLHGCLEPALPAIAVCDIAGSMSQCRDPVPQTDGSPLSLAMA